MANHGPNPTKSNTARSADFINHFLKDVLKAVLRIEKEPDQAPLFSAHFTDTSPVKLEFIHNQAFNSVSIGMSPLALTKHYGKPATRIWRKLFKQVQIGGYNAATKAKIPSRWVPHDDAIRELEQRTMARIGERAEALASDYLAILADFPEIVPTIMEYETVTLNGYERLVKKDGTKKKLMPRAVRAKILDAHKPTRKAIADRNAERFEKYADEKLKQAFEAIVGEDWDTGEKLVRIE